MYESIQVKSKLTLLDILNCYPIYCMLMFVSGPWGNNFIGRRVGCSIMLGIVTYDDNLLVIEP